MWPIVYPQVKERLKIRTRICSNTKEYQLFCIIKFCIIVLYKTVVGNYSVMSQLSRPAMLVLAVPHVPTQLYYD